MILLVSLTLNMVILFSIYCLVKLFMGTPYFFNHELQITHIYIYILYIYLDCKAKQKRHKNSAIMHPFSAVTHYNT